MNQRHQDLIAKVNAGTLTADQARQYSETLKPWWFGKKEDGTPAGYGCECGQCLPTVERLVPGTLEDGSVVPMKVQLTGETELKSLPLPVHHAGFIFNLDQTKPPNGGGMYERFTDRARKVMVLANQEAQRLNHEYIGTEHVLVGLCKEGSGVGCNVLRNLDVNLQATIKNTRDQLEEAPAIVSMGRLPLTPRTKKVIEHAIETARGLGHNHVGTEHLLMGMLLEVEGLAAKVLFAAGVNRDNALEQIKLVLPGTKASPSEDAQVVSRLVELGVDPAKGSSWTCSAVFEEATDAGTKRWLGTPGMQHGRLEAAVQIDGSVKGLIFSTHLDVRHEPVNCAKVKETIKTFLAKCGLEHVEVLVCCGMGVQAVVK